MFEAFAIPLLLLLAAWPVGHLLNLLFERIAGSDAAPSVSTYYDTSQEPVTAYGALSGR